MLHGLLYICDRALTPEEICDTLGLARSNVSTSLRELEDYRLVYRQSVPGDRRSYFTAETDVWEMARHILEERRRRETEGAVSAVQECLASAKREGDKLLTKRMKALQELLGAADTVAAAAQNYPTSVFKRAAQMGSRMLALLAKL
ncbi:MAG: MarR family transcriptional regulator [Akkermansia sp.]|nr:MarR family transcriptional regulator [Akkermansia sp.]